MKCDEMMMMMKKKDNEEEMGKTSDIELNKIRLLRASVEKIDPSSKEVDDMTLRRFLRARDLDVKKACAMFLNYLKWRKEFGSVSPSEVPSEIAQNKMFMQGSDKKGRPITLVFGAKHFRNKDSLDEFKRFLVCTLDKLCASTPPGEGKFVVIADLQGWSYANWDIRGYLTAISVLQDYYPERLGKVLMVHAPYIFMAAWKIIYPFIDNNTREKIVFVDNKKLKSTLLEDIDESQIPEIYGGKMPLVPILETSILK